MTINYRKLMVEAKRESATETKVRAMDAYEIVQWIHRLEDEIEVLESDQDAPAKAKETGGLTRFIMFGGL